MKILHINSYYSSSAFYKNLYDKQIDVGLDIAVFVPVSYPGNLTGRDLGAYSTVSVNHSKYDRYIFHLKHYKIYRDIIGKYKIEDFTIAHAHSLFSNGYIAMKIKQKFGIPYIVAVRNTDVNIFFRYMIHLRMLGIQILKNASGIVFLSKSYRDSVIGKYVPSEIRQEILKKTSIIPNGINDFWFRNKGIDKKKPIKRNLKLLFVGDVNKNKNVITTVKAITIINQKGYNIRFTIVGEIKDKTVYNQISDLDFVHYVPPKPKEELIEIYRNNDIFIMPSITETFGLVYAEAMSQGLPVIYTKGQGFDGQFEDGFVGYCVSPINPTEIAEAIINVFRNYKELTYRARKYCSRFNWNDINMQYKHLYMGVLDGRGEYI